MNTLAFGSPKWEFLHCTPWMYPNEILSPQDASECMLFIEYFTMILPCRYCRESATKFKRELDVWNKLGNYPF